MAVDPDVIAELRSLRKGRGLTPAGVARATKLMTALQRDDAHRAYELIVTTLREMGEDLEVRALRNAYGIDMSSPGKLTARRNDFALANDRHVDTIENYENRTIDELASRLGLTGAQGPMTLFQLGFVGFGNRIDEIKYAWAYPHDTELQIGTSPRQVWGVKNPEKVWASMPLLLFRAIPNVQTLVMSVEFVDREDHTVTFNYGDTIDDIIFRTSPVVQVERDDSIPPLSRYMRVVTDVVDGRWYALAWWENWTEPQNKTMIGVWD